METPKPKTEFKRWSKPLDQQKIAELGKQQSDLRIEMQNKEDEKSTFDSRLSKEIKSLDAQCLALAKQIKEGTIDEDVECTVEYDSPEHNKKTFYRWPEGTQFCVEDMTQEEIERLAAPLFNKEEKEEIKKNHVCKNCLGSCANDDEEEINAGLKLLCQEEISQFIGLGRKENDSCEYCHYSPLKEQFGFDPILIPALEGKYFVNDGSFSLSEKMIELSGVDNNDKIVDAVKDNTEKIAGHLVVYGPYQVLIPFFNDGTNPMKVLKINKDFSFYAFAPLPITEESPAAANDPEPTEEDSLHIPANVEEEEF